MSALRERQKGSKSAKAAPGANINRDEVCSAPDIPQTSSFRAIATQAVFD
jgi:hypothetical protein